MPVLKKYNKSKYMRKANRLLGEKFGVYGQGAFDTSVEEVAYILYLVENNYFTEVRRVYKALAEERLS